MREDVKTENAYFDDWDDQQKPKKNNAHFDDWDNDPQKVAFYLKQLESEDSTVQSKVMRSLEKIENPKTIQALIDALRNHSDPKTRANAAKALAVIKNTCVTAPLIESLRDQDSSVRFAAYMSLMRITGKNHGLDYEAWKKWRGMNIKCHFSSP